MSSSQGGKDREERGNWRDPRTLPDGRVVEYVMATDDGEGDEPGSRNIDVTVAIDGVITTLPVVLDPDDIARVLGPSS